MKLDDILDAARDESAERQNRYPLALLQRKVEKMGPSRGFARALRKRPFSVIAEIKRQSPSMGIINEHAIDVARGIYASHPVVSAISVLTQERYFKGTTDDLEKVRNLTQSRSKPILRKDFIFSDYEVYFSRWVGADAILLMANVVEDRLEFKRLHDLAVKIGLDVLCEIHDEREIETLPDTVKICGINSRRFKGVEQRERILDSILKRTLAISGPNRDTQTDLNAFDLFEKLPTRLPANCLIIAESGISAENIGSVLSKYQFNAALIGTSLLKSKDRISLQLDEIEKQATAALHPASPASSHSGKSRVPLAV